MCSRKWSSEFCSTFSFYRPSIRLCSGCCGTLLVPVCSSFIEIASCWSENVDFHSIIDRVGGMLNIRVDTYIRVDTTDIQQQSFLCSREAQRELDSFQYYVHNLAVLFISYERVSSVYTVKLKCDCFSSLTQCVTVGISHFDISETRWRKKAYLKVYFKTHSRSSWQTTMLFIDPPCFTLTQFHISLLELPRIELHCQWVLRKIKPINSGVIWKLSMVGLQ